MAIPSRLPAMADPAMSAFAITPNDSTDLSPRVRAIYVGGDGNLSIVPIDHTSNTGIVFYGVRAGTVLPVATRRVLTATTATNLVGLY